MRADDRVRFLDFPKGPHHGERYRHDAVLAARSDAIFYLCDDDLLLPDHVADLLALLEDHNLSSRSTASAAAARSSFVIGDLADPDRSPCCSTRTTAVQLREHHRHRAHPRLLRAGRRSVGTPPRRVGGPTTTSGAGSSAHPDFRGATTYRMTALQLPTSEDGRDGWTGAERQAELSAGTRS